MTGDGTANVCAELVGLHRRALGKLAAGNARREAEIVLDAHAAAGLAAWACPLEHDGSQSFRGGINGRAEAGRAGAHHDQIICRVLERAADAERLGELSIRGVAQDQLAPPGHHGRVGLAHSKLLQELL